MYIQTYLHCQADICSDDWLAARWMERERENTKDAKDMMLNLAGVLYLVGYNCVYLARKYNNMNYCNERLMKKQKLRAEFALHPWKDNKNIYIPPTRQDMGDCTNEILTNVVNDAVAMDPLFDLSIDLNNIINQKKWIEDNPNDFESESGREYIYKTNNKYRRVKSNLIDKFIDLAVWMEISAIALVKMSNGLHYNKYRIDLCDDQSRLLQNVEVEGNCCYCYMCGNLIVNESG